MRRSLVVVLAAAFMLLVIGVGAGWGGHADVVSTRNSMLAHRATEQAHVLHSYFSRARAIALLVAQSPAFTERPGHDHGKHSHGSSGAVSHPLSAEALGYLETLYPDSIGEACLIDDTGTERARVVRGKVAHDAELSDEEEDAPFFEPTFDLGAGRVYQAAPYVSPDTGEWVVANSTVLPDDPDAIVHFEVTVESFRKEAAEGSEFQILIVDADDGRVVVDTKLRQRMGVPLGAPDDDRFRGLAPVWGRSGITTVGGVQAAYERVPDFAGNANRWYAVVLAPSATSWLSGVSSWALLVVALGLLLVAYAATALRRGQRELVSAATTDSLTGLGNRRLLFQDLEHAVGGAGEDECYVLVIADLNGFKSYNDSYGHPAGDALLVRLGTALEAAVGGRGQAYRLGGDEFCVLARLGPGGQWPVVAAVAEALSERGEAFQVTASVGTVLIPVDARDASDAMRTADLRMYEQKNNDRRSAERQTADVLVRALAERDAPLAQRISRVVQLANQTAVRLGVDRGDLTTMSWAAQLHDIGKVAISDAVLRKPGPLTAEEWDYVRQHPIIGERIVAAAPGLLSAGRVVRQTHERFDGTGYPDRLAGAEISPLARIIAVCDAFVAMTSERPHAAALSVAEAVSEIERCAGMQFDPQVATALVHIVRANQPDETSVRPVPPRPRI